MEQVVVGVAQVIAASVVFVIAIVLLVQRRWRRLGVLIIGATVAGITMRLLDHLLELPETTRAIPRNGVTVGWIQDPSFPSSAYLAASAAVVTLASVWLSRQWKRALWAAVVLLMLLRVLSSVAGALDVVLAVAVGVVVGSARAGRVRRAQSGTRHARARPGAARHGPWTAQRSPAQHPDGDALVCATDADGHEMFVKLRTPDDRSADYLAGSTEPCACAGTRSNRRTRRCSAASSTKRSRCCEPTTRVFRHRSSSAWLRRTTRQRC